jgi:hypothetical protein
LVALRAALIYVRSPQQTFDERGFNALEKSIPSYRGERIGLAVQMTKEQFLIVVQEPSGRWQPSSATPAVAATQRSP